jgi:hypothetical protein
MKGGCDTVSGANRKIFISYAHQDNEGHGIKWLDEFRKHLKPYERKYSIEPWDDRNIQAGEKWFEEIEKARDSAAVAVLFVTPDFLASDFIREHELIPILRREKESKIRVLWIPVKSSSYKLYSIKDDQALIDPKHPLSEKLSERDKIFVEICEKIDGILNSDSPPDTIQENENKPKSREGFGVPTFPSIGSLLKGREKEIENIERALFDSERPTAITQAQSLSGLGGIGKTRLSVELGWRALREKRVDRTIYLKADSKESLHSHLAELAVFLGLVDSGAPEMEQTNRAIAWLGEEKRYLLVLDNADTEDVVPEIERLINGWNDPLEKKFRYFLITSRHRRWSSAVGIQPVDTLEDDAAVEFILQYTEGRRLSRPDDSKSALELAKEFEGLPLALEQASAYIANNGCSIREYVEDWTNHRDKLLRERPATLQYPVALAYTWQRTLPELCPLAQAMIHVGAFLSPDPIPIAIFEQNEELLEKSIPLLEGENKKVPEGRSIRDALGDLVAFSFATRSRNAEGWKRFRASKSWSKRLWRVRYIVCVRNF